MTTRGVQNHIIRRDCQPCEIGSENCEEKTLKKRLLKESNIREVDDSDEERDLTNLNWLLRNQSLTWPDTVEDIFCDDEKINRAHSNYSTKLGSVHQTETTEISPKHSPQKKSDLILINRNKITQTTLNPDIGSKRPTPAERFEIFINKIKRDLAEYKLSASNYETDVSEKPPFNYSHLIGMALLENGRVTLQQLCAWIQSKFAFFRMRSKWNNSIRHNLSLHHCFRKIDRNREERGKGGYWELGVDPKKCDRKRVRNRKSTPNKNVSKTRKGKPIRHTTCGKSYGKKIPNVKAANNNAVPKMGINVPILEISDENDRPHLFVHESDDISYESYQVGDANLAQAQSDQLQPYQSFSVSEFGLSDTTGSQDSNGIASFNTDLMATSLENIHLQQQNDLGTIIISTKGILDDQEAAVGVNLFSGDTFGSSNMDYLNDDGYLACKNINISSQMSVLAAFSGANEECQTMIIPNTDSSSDLHKIVGTFGTSNGSFTINYDYTNLRPAYVDAVEEPCQNLTPTTEKNRNEDLFDTLIDVSITEFYK